MSEARARRQDAATFDELVGGDDTGGRAGMTSRGRDVPTSAAGRGDSDGSVDPASADPTLQRMVAMAERLRGMDVDAGPSADFRAALRTRLLELPAAAAQQPARTIRPAIAGGARARLAMARDLLRFPQLSARTVAGMAMLAMIVAMAGVLVIASRGALPGDSLYAVKRASERAELALTIGGESRGMTLLSFAQTRLTEVDELIRQEQQLASGAGNHAASGGLDEATVELTGATLDDMDADTRRGAKLLTNRAVETGSTAPLSHLSTWTAAHRAELATMLTGLPADVAGRAQESSVLLDWVDYRVLTLQYSFAHACPLSLANADELGPLPCSPEGTQTALGQAPNSPAPDSGPQPSPQPGTGDTDGPGTSPDAGTTGPGAPAPQTDQTPADPTTPALPPLPPGQPGPPGTIPPQQPGQTSPPGAPLPPESQLPPDQQIDPPPGEQAPPPAAPGDPTTPPPPPPDAPAPSPPPPSPPSSCLLPGPLGQLLNVCLG